MAKMAERWSKSAALTESLSILDGYSDPAILVAPDYRVLGMSARYRERFGGATNDAELCHLLSHRSPVPCDQAGESCPLTEALKTGMPSRALHIHHTPRGDEHVDVEARPVFDVAGHIQYCVEILRPVGGEGDPAPKREGLVGRTPAFNRMLGMVQRVAPSEAAVLLIGETGTGKELVAHAIHEQSRQQSGAFVPVECSGLTETLFESELFGYEKGAFTGAQGRKPGLIEYARGGTLFLDEIGDIPLHLQVKLLRLLETRSFRRVGGVEPIQADFRLISATHRDLKEMVANGRFREDLYYRISTFPILLPALRDRREDIPHLVETLLKRIPSGRGLQLEARAMKCLLRYGFPGNVRELRNILERASLLTDGELILERHLSDLCRNDSAPAPPSLCADGEVMPLAEVERIYLRQALAHHEGDRASLAQKLGISERTLFRKLRELA